MTHVTAHRFPIALLLGLICAHHTVGLSFAYGAAIELSNRFADGWLPLGGHSRALAGSAADPHSSGLQHIAPDRFSMSLHGHQVRQPLPTDLAGVIDMYDAGRLPLTGAPPEGLPVAKPPVFHLIDEMALRTPLRGLSPVPHPMFNVSQSVGRIIEHLITPPENLLFDEPSGSLNAWRRTAEAERLEGTSQTSVPLPGTLALFAAGLVLFRLVRTETRMHITTV